MLSVIVGIAYDYLIHPFCFKSEKVRRREVGTGLMLLVLAANLFLEMRK
jgi:hypothetical protein